MKEEPNSETNSISNKNDSKQENDIITKSISPKKKKKTVF